MLCVGLTQEVMREKVFLETENFNIKTMEVSRVKRQLAMNEDSHPPLTPLPAPPTSLYLSPPL